MFKRVRQAMGRADVSSPGTRGQREASRLSPGFHFEGEMSGSGEVVLLGRYDGTIELDGRLSVGPEGRVDGKVQARDLVLDGTLEAEIEVADRIVITSSGIVTGSVRCAKLVVEEGGRLVGPCRMRRKGRADAPDAKPSAASAAAAPAQS